MKRLNPSIPTIIQRPNIIKNSKLEKKEELQPSVVVFQHNNLIEARYSLTLQEKKIILWLISQIQPDDKDFKSHTLTVKSFMELVGLAGKANYKELQNITLGLIKKALVIKEPEKKITTQVSWLCSARYEEGEGSVKLSFAPEMHPFLLNLKKTFTAISLSDLMQFKSIHAIRIYELLKQYQDIGERTLTIEEIKECCGVAGKLERYCDFERAVLSIAQREINKKSDIKFEFERKKHVRKVAAIKFIISKNKLYHSQHKHDRIVNDINVQSISQSNLFSELMDFGLTKKMATKLLSQNADEVIRNAIACVDIQIKKGYARNPKALLITAIKDKYNPNIYQAK